MAHFELRTNKSNYKNFEVRRLELAALKSMYDENVLFVDEERMHGRFLVNVTLPNNSLTISWVLRNLFDSNLSQENINLNERNTIEVLHLPPIELIFALSNCDYPASEPPRFLISCKWLDVWYLEKLCSKLEQIWEDSKMEILSEWFIFLQDELLRFLGCENSIDTTYLVNLVPIFKNEYDSKEGIIVRRKIANNANALVNSSTSIVTELPLLPQSRHGNLIYDRRAVFEYVGRSLIDELLRYNESKEKEIFGATWHICQICSTDILGSNFILLGCRHLHCKKCIGEHLTSFIKSGNFGQLKCPEENCKIIISIDQIRELVNKELFSKYDQHLLSCAIESMGDVFYCPRTSCQAHTVIDKDANFALCSGCQYPFCTKCKSGYHGIQPCQLENQKTKKKYRRTPKKLQAEKNYG